MTKFALVSLVFSITSMILPRKSQGYLGRTFYLAPMPLYSVNNDPYILKIVSNVTGSVQVVAPGLEINMTYSLTPGITEISLGDLQVSASGVDNKGIQITTTVDVEVYVIEGLYWGGYGKVMSLTPVFSSAKAFVVQGYKTDWDSRKSHFIVIATEDFTDVNITLRTAAEGNFTYRNIIYEDGDIINITLNWLQTFYVYFYANDLSGSVIESNKPVVVLSGADCVDIPKHGGGGCNIIESQMTPVSQWGNLYIVPPVYPAVRCHVRLFAFHNDSQISVTAKFDSGNITLNRGEFWETTHLCSSHGQPVVISSDKGISVVLYGASAGESDEHKSNPFMLVVPEIRQYSTSAATFHTLQYGDYSKNERPFENYAAIVSKKSFLPQLQYNGSAPDILRNYSVTDALNEYIVVIIPLENATSHTISMVNTSTPIPMAVFVYGMARFESYGFVAGAKFIYADCSNLVAPLHGTISSTVVPHGNHVTVSCNQGYTLSGEQTLVCSSGSLSANVGTCEADCNGLVAPTRGSLSSIVLSHGNHVTVSCNHGYTLSGERTLICLSGSLSGNIGTCEGDCNGLVAPIHGSLSSTVISHGNHVIVSCNHGYTLSGDRTLVCLSGSLSGSIGTCESDCSGLVAPAYSSLSSKAASHGNHVTVSCNTGYKLSGERTLVCSSGSWSGNIGTCEVEEGPSIEGSNPLTTTILGGVLGFIIIFFLGIIIVMCVRHKRKSIKDTSTTKLTLKQIQVNNVQTGNNQEDSSVANGVPDSNVANGGPDNNLANGRPYRNLANGRPHSSLANGEPDSSLANDGTDSSIYATLNLPEPPYLTPISSHSIRYYNNNV